jgi:hypothetical protein
VRDADVNLVYAWSPVNFGLLGKDQHA